MDEQAKAKPIGSAAQEQPPKVKKKNKKKNQKPAASRGRADTLGSKGKPWAFPKNTLEDAIGVPKAIEDKFAGNPTPAAQVALALGFRQPKDWRFGDLLRSANQYGLVNGTGPTSTVELTSLGQDIVAPSSSTQRLNALRTAFRTVKDFENVENFYRSMRLPEDEFFFNTLTRQFEIPKDRVDAFAQVFRDNLSFLRSFTPPTSAGESEELPQVTTPATADEALSAVSQQPIRTREFLDTCFVMMPFGEWPDIYYRDIYIPAIKEAGLEPSRADELFHTGSVVEQIWDQISKSRLLLADLSGKNPNVFYELGLAHAASKPVIFTAANVDDVPFDLRHLRVIIYDIRKPDWGVRLKVSITDYLRNAMKEPGKSIPHPWKKRDEEEER